MAKSIRAKGKVRIRTMRREATTTQSHFQTSLDSRTAALEAAAAAPPVERRVKPTDSRPQFEEDGMEVEKAKPTPTPKALKAKKGKVNKQGKKMTAKQRYQINPPRKKKTRSN